MSDPGGEPCALTSPCPPADRPGRDAARTIACHPSQGWSLLCNGVVVFDDTGQLLPENSSVVWRATPNRDTLPGTLRGFLDGYISCYELTLTGVRPRPEGFVSAMPASLRRTRRRCEPRARCAAARVAR
jgi:hypothetical protein